MAMMSLLSFSSASSVPLVTFDGAQGSTFQFTVLNDPVMGGRSHGTWSLNQSGFGVLDGAVVDVPSLKAPGFITAVAEGSFADASSEASGGLTLLVRSTTAYAGYRISLYSGIGSGEYSCAGGGGIPFSRGCFKAHFAVPPGATFQSVYVPFSNFTDRWSSATGEPTATCASDSSACLTASKLAAVKRLELWAEGVDGTIHLEVQSIAATSAAAARTASTPPLTSKASKAATTGSVELIKFDSSSTWRHTDDPVMGGQSKSTYEQHDGVGTFNGTCAIVPSLNAPGFCKVASVGGSFPDASRFVNGSLLLRVRSSTPSFGGFKVAVDAAGLKCPGIAFSPFTTSWKAPFTVPAGSTFSTVSVPFSSFSCDWSSYTGACDTKDPGIFGRQHYCCTAQHPEKCPSVAALGGITGLEVWAEGAAGDFELELESISAGM